MKSVVLLIGCLALVSCSLIRHRKQIEQTPCQQADLAFVLDVSNSIGFDNWEKELRFVDKVIDLYDVGTDLTRVAAVTFGKGADTEFQFTLYQSKDAVMQALRGIQYGTSDKGLATWTYAGLKLTRKSILQKVNGARDKVPDIVVVITDGRTWPGRGQITLDKAKKATQEEAALLRGMGATVFTIGVGYDVDDDELRGIAGNKDHYLQAKTFDELNSEMFFKDVEYQLCKDPNKQCENKQMDIAFVLDESSSLRYEANFMKELSFVTDVMERIRMSNDETRVAIVKFGNESSLEVPFGMYQDTKALKERVKQIQWRGGNTHMDLALNMLVDEVFTPEKGARPNVEKMVVFITDGETSTREKTAIAVQRVHNAGLNVFAIGVGPQVSKDELMKISSSPDQFYMVNSTDALDTVQGVLNDQICPNNTEKCYQQPSEIVFLLDASTSINQVSDKNFFKELSFLAGLSDSFNIGPTGTRFAVITFSDNARLEFGLDAYTSKKELQNRIFNVGYMTGNTNTGDAIRTMVSQGFAGARPGVPKFGVVITDGKAQDSVALKEALKLVDQADIHMIAIGVGDDISEDELRNIASDANSMFPVVGPEALKFVEDKLVITVCREAMRRADEYQRAQMAVISS